MSPHQRLSGPVRRRARHLPLHACENPRDAPAHAPRGGRHYALPPAGLHPRVPRPLRHRSGCPAVRETRYSPGTAPLVLPPRPSRPSWPCRSAPRHAAGARLELQRDGSRRLATAERVQLKVVPRLRGKNLCALECRGGPHRRRMARIRGAGQTKGSANTPSPSYRADGITAVLASRRIRLRNCA